MEYPKLKEILNDRALLDEEKKMWLRVGFYITADSYIPDRAFTKHVDLYDGMGNKTVLQVTTGTNIRQSILNWWQVERIKPRAKEIIQDNTGISELENRNAT